jgi:hypothetical protein
MTSTKNNEECGICIEKYKNTINRKKVSCNYCNYDCCVGCAQTYLVSQAMDAHCMNCRTGWNREFIDLNMTKTFRTKEWREHKKVMIVNREKSFLPTMQRYAAAKKKMEEIRNIQIKQNNDLEKIISKRRKFLEQINAIRNDIIFRSPLAEDEANNIKKLNEIVKDYNIIEDMHRIEEIYVSKNNRNYTIEHDIYNDTNTVAGVKEKKEFILKCVKEGCRGFLSTSYKCELCSIFVCKDCMIPKSEKDDDIHECKKDDVDTIRMIRKDTKPCPKCGIRISKIDGCDQMWCVAESCGTPFSWNTGKIVSDVIHNPHYYEWVRRNNNGVIPRNPADNPCNNRNVQYYELYRAMNANPYIKAKDRLKISGIHRLIVDVEQARLPSYPQTRNVNMFKELHCDFLLNKIDEASWKQSMFLKENSFEKKQQIGFILNTFVTIAKETMDKFYNELLIINASDANPDTSKKSVALLNKYNTEFEHIRSYINDSLVDTGTTMMCAVPQIYLIDDGWSWHPITKVEKILAERNKSKTSTT